MYILGISGLHNSVSFKKAAMPGLSPREYRIVQGLDSAAALLSSDGIQAAAAEERFTREKGTGAFPVHALRYCLQHARLNPDQIDLIAHGFSYDGLRPFFDSADYTRRQYDEVYSRDAQVRWGRELFPSLDWEKKLFQVPHHLAHAASTFYPSGFEESLILVADAMGEVHSTTVAVGKGRELKIVKQIPATQSLGILYGALTYYLGFWPGLDEYKVMGLAPYGDPNRYFERFMEFVHLQNDGTYTVPLLSRNKSIEEMETYSGVLRTLIDAFGPPREQGSTITQHHMDIAAALQATLQTCLLHLLRHFRRETGQTNLCLAGGVALNCTANGSIKRSRMFRQVFVQPAAGDDGSALGAALWAQRIHEPGWRPRRMDLPLWGPSFDTETVRDLLGGREECESTFFPSFEELAGEVARRISESKVVGWFQDRLEYGPRALGSRSILADPRDPGMRDRLNLLVKNREDFRPFAPAVTAEGAVRFFEIEEGEERTYAHMLFVVQVRPEFRTRLPAVTHVDGSARIQTVARDENPRFWTVLKEFENLTGLPVLVNTSFNVRGQPIVCTPAEAVDTFLSTGIDLLAIDRFLVVRKPR